MPFYTYIGGLFEDIHIEIGDETIQGDPSNDDGLPTPPQPSVMTSQAGSGHDSLHPETSTPDVIVCEQFYESTCGCDKDHGKPCSKMFTVEHFIEFRAQCSFLTKDELDLALMGFISSALLNTDVVRDGRHQNPAKRRRITMKYQHHGLEVCKKTFLFLHGIGKDRLHNVKQHYNGEGLQVRINKNTKRSPHHAMSFAAKRYVVTFLHNYAEENAILLPGRIPAYKRDDIKLLPSNRSKAVRYFQSVSLKTLFSNTEYLGVLL